VGDLSEDEQWLQMALKKVVARIRDPKALPIDELLDKEK
jgi:hypothetical protein